MTDLRKLAEQAMPGGAAWGSADDWKVLMLGHPDTAAYIAAAHPQAVIALLDRIDALEAAVKAHQKLYELEKRVFKLDDCGCINLSRDYERLYETGRCPHQLTRAALKDSSDD